MNAQILVPGVVVLAMVLLVVFQIRRSQKRLGDLETGRRTLDEADIWLANSVAAEAEVVSREVVISPQARKIAKVDLEFRIQQPGRGFAVSRTCWLVEVGSLSQLEPGRKVSVKFNPRKPRRIFPAVPWARAWLFGKPGK